MTIGYDKLAINHQLLLHLTLEEMIGAAGSPTYDRAKPHHPCTLRGATIAWGSLASGLPYLDLSPSPDFIDCPAVATADLDFTTGDYSTAVWLNPDLASGAIIVRGVLLVDGWELGLSVHAGGDITLTTSQAGALQYSRSAAGTCIAGGWSLIGARRSGPSVSVVHNGIDVTEIRGVHIDPLTSNRELHIGCRDNELVADCFRGKIAGGPCGPRIWGRALSDLEWLGIFESESPWLGV